MKRSPRKLTLHRETLRNLDEESLSTAAGGSGATCTPSCNTLCLVCPGSKSVCYDC